MKFIDTALELWHVHREKYNTYRDNAVIKELHISQEQREKVQELLKNNYMKKSEIIKKITGFRSCSSCAGIPDVELSFDLQGASKIERYCESCIKKVFERVKEEPKSKEELAEYYGCEIGIIPHYQPSYHDPWV
jgi:hypothetical protein